MMSEFPIIPLLNEFRNDKTSLVSLLPMDIIRLINTYSAIETFYDYKEWKIIRRLRGTDILWGRQEQNFVDDFESIEDFKKRFMEVGGDFYDYENDIQHGWEAYSYYGSIWELSYFDNGTRIFDIKSNERGYDNLWAKACNPKYNFV